MPEWAASLLWLGEWCRSFDVPLHRLVTLAILPTRDLAAVFAGIGVILGGAKLYKDTLSWPRFRALPVGTTVFWQKRGGGAKLAGTIVSFTELESTEFISVNVTSPLAIAKKGLVQSISKNYFDAYAFSLEKPPTDARASALDNAARFIKSVNGGIDPKWMGADGAEGLIVTNMGNFEETLLGLTLRLPEKATCEIDDLLCLGKSRAQTHAKLKLSHAKGDLSGSYPLVILDGPESFEIHEHLDDSSNLLIFLARSEYTTGIDDRVQLLRNASERSLDRPISNIPDRLPCGVELVAYSVRRS